MVIVFINGGCIVIESMIKCHEKQNKTRDESVNQTRAILFVIRAAEIVAFSRASVAAGHAVRPGRTADKNDQHTRTGWTIINIEDNVGLMREKESAKKKYY